MADPRIRYDIQATAEGQEDVARLTRELEKLDSAIDPAAAARAGELAAKLRILGQQDAAIGQFVELKNKTQAAAQALNEAQVAAQALGKQIAATEAPTRTQTGQMAKLSDAVKSAKAELQAQTIALDASRKALGSFGLETDGLSRAQVRVRQDLAATASEAGLIAQRYQQAASAAQSAARQQVEANTTVKSSLQGIQGSQLSDSINGAIGKFAGIGAAVASVGAAVTPVLQATAALESMRRVLTTVTGSADTAAQQIEFVRNVAARSGQAFDAVGQSYSKFVASALQTGLTLKDTQAVFESVSLAAGNLGLSSEQSSRALEALSQIASKGVVSMEELRGQLGDALPGVLPLLAKQLGLTTSELNKVVESGQLLASEAIPAIGQALRKLGPEQGAQVDGLSASWNRFIGIVKEAGVTVAEGPLGKSAGLVVSAFAGAIRDATVVAVAFSEAIGATARSAGAVVAALTGAFSSFAEFRAAVSSNFEQAGKAVAAFEARAYGASAANEDLARSAAEAAAASVKAAGGTEQQAQSLAKLALVQTKAIADAELQTTIAERLAQAAEQEAKAQEVLIKLVNDEGDARARSAKVSADVAAARELVVTRAEAETVALRAARQAVLDRVGADEQQLAGAKKLLDQFDEKIKKADADLEKSKSLADSARNQADAATLSAKAYGDQSGALGQLRANVDAAQRAYDAIERSFRLGRQTTDDLARADKALLEAKHLLNDALKDQDDATKRTIDSIKAASEVTRAEIQLEITKLEIKRQTLVQNGQTAAADRLALDIKRLEVQASRSSTDAKVAEAKATQELILRQFAQADAANTLTPALRQELNTRYEQQRAIILQTEASRLNEAQEIKNIDATAAGTTARKDHTAATGTGTTAVDGHTKATDNNTGAAGRNRDAVSTLTGEWKKYADALQTAREKMDAAVEAERRRQGVSGGLATPSDSTLGLGAARINGPADGRVFTAAGQAARNASFGGTPFQTGSTGGGTYATGQAANKPTNGEWTYVISGFDVNGVDARGNRVPGGWKYMGGGVSGLDIQGKDAFGRLATGAAGGDYALRGFATPAGAPADGAGMTAEANRLDQLQLEIQLEYQLKRIRESGGSGPGTSAPSTVIDTDTPGTRGSYTAVPILGKYEVSFTNERTGVSTSSFTDTADQAQAFIDNLQAAFRSSNGG